MKSSSRCGAEDKHTSGGATTNPAELRVKMKYIDVYIYSCCPTNRSTDLEAASDHQGQLQENFQVAYRNMEENEVSVLIMALPAPPPFSFFGTPILTFSNANCRVRRMPSVRLPANAQTTTQAPLKNISAGQGRRQPVARQCAASKPGQFEILPHAGGHTFIALRILIPDDVQDLLLVCVSAKNQPETTDDLLCTSVDKLLLLRAPSSRSTTAGE